MITLKYPNKTSTLGKDPDGERDRSTRRPHAQGAHPLPPPPPPASRHSSSSRSRHLSLATALPPPPTEQAERQSALLLPGPCAHTHTSLLTLQPHTHQGATHVITSPAHNTHHQHCVRHTHTRRQQRQPLPPAAASEPVFENPFICSCDCCCCCRCCLTAQTCQSPLHCPPCLLLLLPHSFWVPLAAHRSHPGRSSSAHTCRV